MKTSPKSRKKTATKEDGSTCCGKPIQNCKDGYGAHWHSVGWIAAIAIVLSTATMTLAASAQDVPVTSSGVMQGINDVQTRLMQMRNRLDTLDAKVDALSK